MNTVMKACIVTGLVVLVGRVSAAPVTFNFNTQGYTHLQPLEGSVFGGATLTSELGTLVYNGIHGGLAGNAGISADIFIGFSDPVNSISVTARDHNGDYDRFALDLYEFGSNDFLGRIESPMFNGPDLAPQYTLSPLFSNVGRVVFDPGNAGTLPGVSTSPCGVVISALSYEISCNGEDVIPAPGALMLGAVGTALVTWLRSRHLV